MNFRLRLKRFDGRQEKAGFVHYGILVTWKMSVLKSHWRICLLGDVFLHGRVCVHTVRQVQGPPQHLGTSSYIQYNVTCTSRVCPWLWALSTSFCRSVRCKVPNNRSTDVTLFWNNRRVTRAHRQHTVDGECPVFF